MTVKRGNTVEGGGHGQGGDTVGKGGTVEGETQSRKAHSRKRDTLKMVIWPRRQT